MQLVKVTVAFEPSPSISPLVNVPASERGDAGYAARVVLDDGKGNQKELPSIKIGVGESSFSFEAPLGYRAVILVAAVNAAGDYSPATPMEMVVSEKVPPVRPTQLRVQSADVIASEPEPTPAPKLSIKPTVAKVMVSNHPDLKDGVIGNVLNEFDKSTIVVDFENSSRRADKSNLTDPTLRYELDIGFCKETKLDVVWIKDDQTTGTFEELLAELNK